jgi:gas vesicle protein
MNKYKIEDKIDFFEELYKSLVIEDDYNENNNNCLISNEQLTDKFVELNCGHKFNYIPLYNDIVNHKKKFNFMEGNNSHLKLNEIRCPYCRNKQDKLLPYYEELGLHKVNGVNFYQENLNKKINKNCEYEILNDNYDDKIEESESNKKYKCCCTLFSTQIVEYNINNSLESIFTYGDKKYYCYQHKRIMIKKYKLEKKEKMIQEKKEIKAQIKSQIKAEKETAKEEAKNAKKKIKEQAKNTKQKKNENIVLSPKNQPNCCLQILKTGICKGKPCGCKVFSENVCKRHYLQTHKELIIVN